MPAQLASFGLWTQNLVTPRQKSECPGACSSILLCTYVGTARCAVQPPAVLLCSLQPPSTPVVKVLGRKDGPEEILSWLHRSSPKALQYFLSNNTGPG